MELAENGQPISDILELLEGHLDRTATRQKFLAKDYSQFHEHSYAASQIYRIIQDRLSHDLTYESGRILGAMTTPPHPFAKYLYLAYIERNLGDPGLIPGTKQLEQEIVHILGTLLGDGTVQGNFVSGGTEANLIAMYLAKQIRLDINNPEVVVPDSAHYSFDKAASLLGLKLRRASLNEDYLPDMDEYESLINENTIALVGVAGTTALGLVDPIDQMAKLARKYQLFLHVDAAFGGLVLPFLHELGHPIPPYNFDIPEITTMTVDPHKMGMGVNPSGTILVRDTQLLEYGFKIPYLAGGGFRSYNITGTRPGASVVAFWGLLHYLGKKGFRDIVASAWDNTIYLYHKIQDLDKIESVVYPQTNVLGLRLTPDSGLSIERFDHELRKKGWALGLFRQWNMHRVVMMPHIRRDHIDAFLQDLKIILS